jgi:hypothetical protein
VVLTLAVQDGDLRAALDQATHLVDGGDYAEGVAVARTVFKETQGRWHQLQSSNSGRLSAARADQRREPLAVEVAELRDLARDGALAPDGQEYLWFRRLLREKGDLLDENDARRTVAFVFWWVIRLEAVLSTWEPDRQARRDRAQRHVRIGSGPASIALASSTPVRGRVLLQQSGGTLLPDEWLLTFTLRDVPTDEDYLVWAQCIRELLPPPAGSRWHVRPDGTVLVHVPDEAQISVRVDELRAVLTRAESVLDERERQRTESRAVVEAECLEYEEELARAGSLPQWVLGVERAVVRSEEVVVLTLDESLRIPASVDSIPASFSGQRESLVSRLHAYLRDAAGSCYSDGKGKTAMTAVAPHRLIELLAAADDFVGARLREHAEHEKQQAVLDLRIEEALKAALQG